MGTPTADGWRVRVVASDGRACGAGVLVTPDLVLTCSHVVARALQVPASGERPAGRVELLLQAAQGIGAFYGVVDEQHWIPKADDHTGDLALLRLERAAPAHIRPAALTACGPPTRRRVRVFGHPAIKDDIGRWVEAEIRGTAGPANEWVQLNQVTTTETVIQRGFSGAGVVDEHSRVIGIVVGSDIGNATRGAWMVAIEAVAARWPLVHTMVAAAHQEASEPTAVADPTRAAYEHALVDTLVRLEGMFSSSARDEIIRALERRLDAPLRVQRSQRARADLFALVAACLDHPSGNVLDQLVQVLRVLHGDVAAVRHVEALLYQDPGRGLGIHDVRQLAALLQALPVERVDAAATLAFGPLGPAHEVDSRDRVQLVRALASLVGDRDQPPPLLRLLNLIEQQTSNGPDRCALTEWIDRLARRWQVSAPGPSHAPRAQSPSVPRRSAIVIQLREDGPDPERFLLSIWLQQETSTGLTGRGLMSDDIQPRTVQEVIGFVGDELRKAIQGRHGPTGPLSVEFVVPYQLLMHELDQMRISLPDRAHSLGAAHPVVLRSLERLDRVSVHHRWKARWRWLVEHQDGPHGDGIRNVVVPSHQPAYRADSPVCLVLTLDRPQTRNAGKMLLDEIKDALDRGMPALLWCRTHRFTSQFAAELGNRLNGIPLGEIPEVVRQIREEAAVSDAPAEHVGSHVALLWDDADRLPSGALFQVPRREE